jgi:hypothetical protein
VKHFLRQSTWSMKKVSTFSGTGLADIFVQINHILMNRERQGSITGMNI